MSVMVSVYSVEKRTLTMPTKNEIIANIIAVFDECERQGVPLPISHMKRIKNQVFNHPDVVYLTLDKRQTYWLSYLMRLNFNIFHNGCGCCATHGIDGHVSNQQDILKQLPDLPDDVMLCERCHMEEAEHAVQDYGHGKICEIVICSDCYNDGGH